MDLLRQMLSMEELSDGKANVELEYTFYGRVLDPKQLEAALSKESHEQWEIRIPKTDENGSSGRMRIRKTLKDGMQEPEYVLTTKTKRSEGGSMEVGIPTTQDHFEQFKAMAECGMLKDRYTFEIEGMDNSWEVDMYLKPEGGYWEWCKIDLEVDALLNVIPPFPIDLADIITNQNGKRTEEEEAKVRSLYDFEFLTKNPAAEVKKDKVAVESIFSDIAGYFSKKTKSAESVEKSQTKSELQLYEWISQNFKNGKLNAKMKPHGREITLNQTVSRMFFNQQKQTATVSDVVSGFSRDLVELKKVFGKHKSAILKAADVVSKLDKDAAALSNSADAAEKLRALVLKSKDKLPEPVVDDFQEPSHSFYGNYSTGFTKKEDNGNLVFVDQQKPTGDKNVSFSEVTQKDIDSLLVFTSVLTNFWLDLYEVDDKIPSGIDITDPPFRYFFEELGDDLKPVLHPTFEEQYVGLIPAIIARVEMLEKSVWELIRASLSETEK